LALWRLGVHSFGGCREPYRPRQTRHLVLLRDIAGLLRRHCGRGERMKYDALIQSYLDVLPRLLQLANDANQAAWSVQAEIERLRALQREQQAEAA
jgi:hypothetical protein